MRIVEIALALAVLLTALGCGSPDTTDDRAAIESIANDIQNAAATGDMVKIDKHLSHQAKADGYDANRFLMDLTYSGGMKPLFKARSIRVMGDSAWLEFTVYPNTTAYSELLERSRVRLMRSRGWKIVTFDIFRNEPMRETSPDSAAVDTMETMETI